MSTKHEYFKNTFFTATIIEWSKLDSKIQIPESIGIFKKNLLTFIRPVVNQTFSCHNLLILLLRLSLIISAKLSLNIVYETRLTHFSFAQQLEQVELNPADITWSTVPIIQLLRDRARKQLTRKQSTQTFLKNKHLLHLNVCERIRG